MAAVGLAGAACAGSNGSGGEVSGGSTAHPAPPHSGTVPSSADEVPRTDLTAERVVEWTRYEIVSDRQLRFFFPAGNAKCYGARAVIREQPSTVKVATIVGTLPDAPDNCTMVGRTASILVTTENPVNDREVSHLNPAEARVQVSSAGPGIGPAGLQ